MKNDDRLRIRALAEAQTPATEIPLETIRSALAVLDALEECERVRDNLRAKWVARGKTIGEIQRDMGALRRQRPYPRPTPEKQNEEEDALRKAAKDGVAYRQLVEYLDAKLEHAEKTMLETANWLDQFAQSTEASHPDCPACKARRDLGEARDKLRADGI